jgi:restriction system protein
MSETPPNIFIARAGSNGEDETYALDNNLAIIGFLQFPSVAGAKQFEDVHDIVKSVPLNLKPRAVLNYARQLWAFAFGMQQGDIVVLPSKLTSQVALGRVTGSYQYVKVNGVERHTRTVEWVRPDVARSIFSQDLLHSFGAFLTVCRITRHHAGKRILAILEGKPDPGFVPVIGKSTKQESPADDEPEEAPLDLGQAAHDQIVAHIQCRFNGHGLSRLVDAVLGADGWVTRLSPPGADGGVDILAGRGPLGLDEPRLCVQVKSESGPVDVTVYRTLLGSMQSFNAKQGLLVAWGGFKKTVQAEARQGHFTVRLWESRDLVEAIYRNYERLPAEIQAELPLKRVWMLVHEEPAV